MNLPKKVYQKELPKKVIKNGAVLTVEQASQKELAEAILRRLPNAGLFPVIRRIWSQTMNRLLPLGGVTVGNELELFFNGDDAFTAMLDAIAAAKESVWLETYIFEPDRLGQKVLDALLAARQRGCDVLLLYDAFGSPHLKGSAGLTALENAGGRIVEFNPLFRLRRRNPLLFRDHRKILVIDHHVGFCGGMNVSEEYAGPRMGNGRFRDTHACVRGPGVHDLMHIMDDTLKQAGLPPLPTVPDCPPLAGGSYVQILRSDGVRHRWQIQRAIVQTAQRSLRTCYLTTPYFVPPRRLTRALGRAARRGVDVRVLTAGRTDVPISKLASEHIYGRLLKRGVRIFELESRTLHAKTAAIDGVYGAVGSFNLDHWSYRRNLEVNVTALDTRLAEELEGRFREDLRGAQEVTLETWGQRSLWNRFLGFFAYQLARV